MQRTAYIQREAFELLQIRQFFFELVIGRFYAFFAILEIALVFKKDRLPFSGAVDQFTVQVIELVDDKTVFLVNETDTVKLGKIFFELDIDKVLFLAGHFP